MSKLDSRQISIIQNLDGHIFTAPCALDCFQKSLISRNVALLSFYLGLVLMEESLHLPNIAQVWTGVKKRTEGRQGFYCLCGNQNFRLSVTIVLSLYNAKLSYFFLFLLNQYTVQILRCLTNSFYRSTQ